MNDSFMGAQLVDQYPHCETLASMDAFKAFYVSNLLKKLYNNVPSQKGG